jgi:predicted RNA binding protein YcfA (HicA-like mRNA interferase family)
MIAEDIKFAELEQLLLSLNFIELPTTGSHKVYEYPSLGTLVVLPGYEQQANVRTMHLVAVRNILDANGLMDRDIFNHFLEKVIRSR